MLNVLILIGWLSDKQDRKAALCKKAGGFIPRTSANRNDSINEKDTLIQSLKNNAAAVDAVGAIAELKDIVALLKKEPEPEKE